jgi:hypothetical protein
VAAERAGETVVLNRVKFRSGPNVCTHFILLLYTVQEEALWWLYPSSRDHNTCIIEKLVDY